MENPLFAVPNAYARACGRYNGALKSLRSGVITPERLLEIGEEIELELASTLDGLKVPAS